MTGVLIQSALLLHCLSTIALVFMGLLLLRTMAARRRTYGQGHTTKKTGDHMDVHAASLRAPTFPEPGTAIHLEIPKRASMARVILAGMMG